MLVSVHTKIDLSTTQSDYRFILVKTFNVLSVISS